MLVVVEALALVMVWLWTGVGVGVGVGMALALVMVWLRTGVVGVGVPALSGCSGTSQHRYPHRPSQERELGGLEHELLPPVAHGGPQGIGRTVVAS